MRIVGLGTALPPWGIDQRCSAMMAIDRCCATPEQARLLPVVYRRSGVGHRASVLLARNGGEGPTQQFFPAAQGEHDAGPGTEARMQRYAGDAPDLAERAATAALREAGIDHRTIAHLVTVSCTGFVAPGFDVALIKRLNLPATVSRTHVGFMGCHGALNGLRVASAYARGRSAPEVQWPRSQVAPDGAPPGTLGSEACAGGTSGAGGRVLLCAVELCSLHFAYGWNPQQIVANALFADGAAAMVLEPDDGERPSDDEHTGDTWRVVDHGACLLPDSEDAMTWRIGDHGFEMTLSPRVPGLIEQHVRPWCERWLATHGLKIGDVGSWAVHPGGPRVLGSVAAALGLDDEALADSHEVLARHGNMSSPTVLFILDRLRARRAPRPCVALGFGPGLAIEAALLR